MTLVILGIVATLGVSMMGGGIQAYFAGRDLVDADWRGRGAIERMTRELRGLRSASAADLNIATAGQVRFNDVTGGSVCYYLNGNDLMRSSDFTTACGTTNAQVLASGISALTFNYYQNDGVSAAAPNLVRYITVQFTVTQGAASTIYRANVTRRI